MSKTRLSGQIETVLHPEATAFTRAVTADVPAATITTDAAASEQRTITASRTDGSVKVRLIPTATRVLDYDDTY